jgi:chromosome segregation ATPase
LDDTLNRRTSDHHQGTEAGIDTNRADRRRSLDALHGLEADAERPSPGRELDWLAHVGRALASLATSLDAQARNSLLANSPLSDIERDEPRLRNRVVQLRERYRNLLREVDRLRDELAALTPERTDIADLRRRVDGLAAELRYQRAREADLIYEAYNVDLGVGD